MLNAHRLQLVHIGSSILQASRNELVMSMRFLDMALSALGYEMNLSTRTVGTDGLKILFNPKYLSDLYLSDRVLVNRTYLHMVLHCVFRHMLHRDGRNEAYWNLACDIAVEAVIDGQKNGAIQLTVSDLREETYAHMRLNMKVLTAEGIYRALIAMDMTELYRKRLEDAFWTDDHSFWDTDEKEKNQNGSNEEQEDSQKEDEKQQKRQEIQETWQSISEKMDTNLETFEKEIGEEAGELLSYLKIENRQRYDYRRFLQKFVSWQEEMRMDDDSFDYIYYTYGLSLYHNMPLIESLEYKELQKVKELVIVIDTSESCTDTIAQSFLMETYSILSQEESFFRKMHVHIIQCDTKVQSHDVITSQEELSKYMENFALRGAGGTDFRPAFEYVNGLIEQKVFHSLKGLIYFTDGYGTFPKKRMVYDVVFAFFKEDYTDVGVPPWAMKLILGPEDFQAMPSELKY